MPDSRLLLRQGTRACSCGGPETCAFPNDCARDAARKGWAHPHLPNEGKTSEWYTPRHVFDAIGLTFDLDPCSPPGGVPWIPATRHYSAADDGLSKPWEGRVWLNPPYGKAAGLWVARLADHGWGIALVFGRSDVQWWHRNVPHATAKCEIERRLTFVAGAGQSAPGNSGGPSVLLAWGDDCAAALEQADLGIVYGPPITYRGALRRVA